MTISRRYCGPPNSGNGGYVCGLLARHISGSAEVTLRAPPPLEKVLRAMPKDDGTWELRDGATVVAIGRPLPLEMTRIETASLEEASAAEKNPVIKANEHLLPMCFVCGPERAPSDGLRIGVGPLKRRAEDGTIVHAATWTPGPDLSAGDGFVAPEFLWSALDCPTGYAVTYDPATDGFDGAPVLLGRLSARIDSLPRPGERCVITAWETGHEGRKRLAECAAFGEAGQLLAVATATWIVVDRQVQLGRS